jgi:hypothetical protein
MQQHEKMAADQWGPEARLIQISSNGDPLLMWLKTLCMAYQQKTVSMILAASGVTI